MLSLDELLTRATCSFVTLLMCALVVNSRFNHMGDIETLTTGHVLELLGDHKIWTTWMSHAICHTLPYYDSFMTILADTGSILGSFSECSITHLDTLMNPLIVWFRCKVKFEISSEAPEPAEPHTGLT